MNIVEIAAGLLAPHCCLICRREGTPLCAGCSLDRFIAPADSCYRCGSYSLRSRTCRGCRTSSAGTPLRHVWASAEYNDAAQDIVALLKFHRLKAAADVIGDWLDLRLPPLPSGTIVVPVPTAGSRVRLRGYDQAGLIARSLARKRGLSCLEALRRAGSTRQVGAGRADRFRQMEAAFAISSPKRSMASRGHKIRGSPVLLIDDVLTTGATLESAAKVLKSHGALTIDAAVFAH